MGKVRSYSNEFKFKVVLEMIKSDLTINEIISKYQVPKSVIWKWRKQVLDNGSNLFSNHSKPVNSVNNADIDKLHATIGRLKVENDFLLNACDKLKL